MEYEQRRVLYIIQVLLKRGLPLYITELRIRGEHFILDLHLVKHVPLVFRQLYLIIELIFLRLNDLLPLDVGKNLHGLLFLVVRDVIQLHVLPWLILQLLLVRKDVVDPARCHSAEQLPHFLLGVVPVELIRLRPGLIWVLIFFTEIIVLNFGVS